MTAKWLACVSTLVIYNLVLRQKYLSCVAAIILKFYRKHFPAGTIGFTIPRVDKTIQPDQNCQLLEGLTIYLVQWELNIPCGMELQCHGNKNGRVAVN